MSQILFDIIIKDVYKTEPIREISINGQGKEISWIFDFKNQSLSKIFLQEYSRYFWEYVQEEFKGALIQIGGMETGAIALIAGLALCAPEGTKVTSFYIRKSRKKSDLANLIEGEILKDVPIILVDDILNNGRTMRKQLKILEAMGHTAEGIFTCLRFRDLSFYQDLTDAGIKIKSIFELNDFSGALPIKNLALESGGNSSEEKYKCEWKVALTDKPNLYYVIPKSGPVLSEDRIYMGADDGTFFCLDKVSGDVVWTYKVMFGSSGKRIFSTAAIFKDKVLFGAYDGNLYCLNRITGQREWVFTDADWIGSSPCVNQKDGIVYVGLEFGLLKKRGGVVALDIKTGKSLWKNYTMEGLTHASPAYNEKHKVVVCGCNDQYMYAFDAKNGDVLWKFKTEGEIKYGAVFDDKRSAVIFGSMDGGVYILGIEKGTLKMKFSALFGFYSTPAILGDRILIGSLDKNVYCFNMQTQKTEWVVETGGRIFASPVIQGGTAFIGSNDGILYGIDIVTGKIHSTIQLTERIVNRIQIDHTQKEGGTTLYIPTHTCEVYKMRSF